jgi:pimeloyl-ACP methyl ester carboxylesterase
VAIVQTVVGSIEYKIEGEAPYLLVSHGTPGGYNQSINAAPFLEAGIGIITPSRPGYLGTPLTSGATLEEQADAFAALLDVLGIEQVVIHGISGGGPPAIYFAARYAERTKALLLTSALIKRHQVEMPGWSSILMTSPAMNQLLAWMFDRFPKAIIKYGLQVESTYDAEERAQEANRIVKSPEKLGMMRELMKSSALTKQHMAGFENDLQVWGAMGRLPLAEIECPTLITHGTADNDIPFEHAEEAYAGIPNAELYRMENAWHLVFLDEGAEEMTEKQVAFVKTQFANEQPNPDSQDRLAQALLRPVTCSTSRCCFHLCNRLLATP